MLENQAFFLFSRLQSLLESTKVALSCAKWQHFFVSQLPSDMLILAATVTLAELRCSVARAVQCSVLHALRFSLVFNFVSLVVLDTCGVGSPPAWYWAVPKSTLEEAK